MQSLFTEILTTFIIFACVIFFAIYKQKKTEKNQDEIDKNLKIFAEFFGVNGANFKEICINLKESKRVKTIDKNMSLSQFVATLGKENFKTELSGDTEIDKKIISECVKNLKDDLRLGLYPLKNGIYLAFLENETTLFYIMDIASNIGENIIYCD